MKRLLFIQPSLQPPGGGNGVAAWFLESLKHEHEISLLTWHPVELDEINDYYGTSLRVSEFTFHMVSPTLRLLLDRVPTSLSLLKSSLLMRLAKRIQHDYDLLLTANNETDFGCPGIQYIHFPWNYLPRPQIDLRWYHVPPLTNGYYRFCSWLCDFSSERMAQNLTLVNSDWTGAKVRERHGIESITLYPSVAGSFPMIPWEERQDGFVCIGRISPEKELEKVIDIIAAVRARGRAVHLHLVGSPDDRRYTQVIRQRVQANADWLYLHEALPRADLLPLLTAHRYGIHGMREEHFGMAVAELVRAGCITFVPHGGGQVEIVGATEHLLYESVAGATAQILRVLDDPELQRQLRTHLAERQRQFSPKVVARQIQNIVRCFPNAPSLDVWGA